MRLALCLEQTLGHRAHAQNLTAALQASDAKLRIVEVEYPDNPKIPWALEGSWKAARSMRRRAAKDDVRFFHTQSISLFAPLVFPSRPFVVSVDATPLQFDEMSDWYAHGKSPSVVESLKRRWYRAVFSRAAAIVAWSQWAADSLVESYGADPAKILVAHPGAGESFFAIPRECTAQRRPRVLFVGGDLKRKGGDLLLESLPQFTDVADLVFVTSDPVEPREGLTVISNATPRSPELLAAYASADIFCLPTRGDCTPVVLGEAMAAGLPVITTLVGSNAETVSNGVDGLLIEKDDRTALVASIRRLATDPHLRETMGAAAREKASERFDSSRNAQRIYRLLESVAS